MKIKKKDKSLTNPNKEYILKVSSHYRPVNMPGIGKNI